MEIIPITHRFVEYFLIIGIVHHLTKVCEFLLGARHWAECWKWSGEKINTDPALLVLNSLTGSQ